MQDSAITLITWVLVVLFDVLLLFEVHLRDQSASVLEHSALAGWLVSSVLVVSIAVFSVYTWGLSNQFLYDMLLAAVLAGDVHAWNTAMNHLCIVLFFTGLQTLCVAVLGAYVALEGEAYKLLCQWRAASAYFDTGLLCVTSCVLAVCAVAVSAVLVHLMHSGVPRPDVLPWDALYIGLQAVMFVLAGVLLMSLRVRKRALPLYLPFQLVRVPQR